MRTECFVSCLQSFAYICYFGPTYSTSASKRCYNSTAWGVQPVGIIVLQISLTGNGKQIRSCRRKTVCTEKQSAPILPSPHTPTNLMAYALLVRWVRRKTRRIRHMMAHPYSIDHSTLPGRYQYADRHHVPRTFLWCPV